MISTSFRRPDRMFGLEGLVSKHLVRRIGPVEGLAEANRRHLATGRPGNGMENVTRALFLGFALIYPLELLPVEF
jgi:hypothetical protein